MGILIGKVLKSKAGNPYIKIGAPTNKLGEVIELKDKEGNSRVMGDTVELKTDDTLFLSSPLDEVDSLVQNGKLSAEDGEVRKSKIPDFIMYNIELNTNVGN